MITEEKKENYKLEKMRMGDPCRNVREKGNLRKKKERNRKRMKRMTLEEKKESYTWEKS